MLIMLTIFFNIYVLPEFLFILKTQDKPQTTVSFYEYPKHELLNIFFVSETDSIWDMNQS